MDKKKIKTDCYYYIGKDINDELQCYHHVKGFCPCDTCNMYISHDEIERQAEIFRCIRKENNNGRNILG